VNGTRRKCRVSRRKVSALQTYSLNYRLVNELLSSLLYTSGGFGAVE